MAPTVGYAAAIGTDDLVIGYEPEVTWGVTPANPSFQLIRLDSEGFSGSKSRTRPSEIDPSGQASAAITTKEESTGSLNFSVSAGTHNELLAASIGGTFSSTGTIAGGTFSNATTAITVATFTSGAGTVSLGSSSGTSCTLTATDATFLSTNAAVVAGKLIKIASGTINGIARVVSVDSTTQLTLADCTFTPANGVISGVTTITSANTCTLTATGALFTTSDLAVKGQFVKIYGAGASSVTRGIARISTVTSATVLQLDMCSWTVAAEAAGTLGTCTLKGSYVRNGITFNSFTFEKKLSSALYLRYAGAFPTGGSLDVGVGDYLKGTLSFLNKKETTDTAALSGATNVAAPTGTVIDSIKGIGTVWRGVDSGASAGVPSAIPGVVQKIGIKWNKEGAAAQYGIGSAAALGMRSGKLLVTGTLSTYFKDFSLYNQFSSEQAGPISYFALDGLPNSQVTKGYVITFCNATIMNPKVVAGGPGQDVMADFEIEGNPDVTGMFTELVNSVNVGKTIQIDYFN